MRGASNPICLTDPAPSSGRGAKHPGARRENSDGHGGAGALLCGGGGRGAKHPGARRENSDGHGGAGAPLCGGGGRGAKHPGASRENNTERGFVLIWVALMLFMLLSVAGFAVDLGNWWLQSTKLQRAVDAGAHAGAVFLPDNLPEAKIKARTETARNGFNDGILSGTANASVFVEQLPNPYQLRVESTVTVDNYFLALIGMDTQTITRDAVGEFEVPIAMGSPENKIGDDPESGDVGSQFWINIAGPGATKISGDRYAAKNCPSSVARCTGSANPGIDNDDYSPDGYFFTMKVKSVDPGKDLIVQVYDGAMTYVGDHCEKGKFPDSGQRAYLESLGEPKYADADERFAGGETDWCTGDQSISGWSTNTTFIVREPDATPWSVTDNPVVDNASCSPQQMPAYNGTTNNRIFEMLDPNDGKYNSESVIDPNDGNWSFAETFRQWATICVIPSGSVQTGEYLLQVRSNVTAGSPLSYDPSINDGGHNRMSIRAGFGPSGLSALDGTHLTINARTKLPIYANATGADTSFHLARILPADSGRTLRVTLFDMGDASSAGTLRILAPAESSSSFSDCTFSRDDGGSLNVSSNCKLNNVSSGNGFNGRIVEVDIPIPADYDCDDTSPTGCWTKVLGDFPSGVQDTTTWSASLLGSPVRLVE